MVQVSGKIPPPNEAMTRYQNTVAAVFSAIAVLLAPALAVATLVTAPVPAQADEAARQFEQSYCFTATGADRWKGCR